MCLCTWRLPRYIFSEHKSAAQSKLLHIQHERVCVYGKFSNFLPWGIKLGVLFAEESANCAKLWTFLTLYGRKICGCRCFLPRFPLSLRPEQPKVSPRVRSGEMYSWNI
jgi:hypothetical protein